MNEENLLESLKLRESDSVDLWRKIQPQVEDRTSIWEFLVPLAAACVALCIAKGWTVSQTQIVTDWPVKELVVSTTLPAQATRLPSGP